MCCALAGLDEQAASLEAMRPQCGTQPTSNLLRERGEIALQSPGSRQARCHSQAELCAGPQADVFGHRLLDQQVSSRKVTIAFFLSGRQHKTLREGQRTYGQRPRNAPGR